MTDDVPTHPRRLAVRVTKDALRQIRGGHPWVFDDSVVAVPDDAEPGDLAVVFDDKRRFVAIGLYDPASPIRIKVLHQGPPLAIDEAFWRGRLTDALELRTAFAKSAQTTGYRLVHGENDRLPGLVVDRYGDHVVIKLYTEALFPYLDTIAGLLGELVEPGSITLRLSRNAASARVPRNDGDLLFGERPEVITFRENGLTFEADVVHGQKTGFFLDQRENRNLVRSRASGRRVLDVFSCTGGFTVNAAAGGATSVHSVDIAPAAIAAIARNVALNLDRPSVATCTFTSSTGDALPVLLGLADKGQRFDLVIVDPPSFASRQSQVDGARAAYRKLTAAAVRLIEPGGVLVQASCSSRVTARDFFDDVEDAAIAAGVALTDIRTTTHEPDHPVGFAQGAYLKAMFATVRTRR